MKITLHRHRISFLGTDFKLELKTVTVSKKSKRANHTIMIDFGQSCFFLSAKHSVNLQFSMGTHERRWYNLPTKYHYTEPVVCFLPSFFIWQYAKAKYVPYLL